MPNCFTNTNYFVVVSQYYFHWTSFELLSKVYPNYSATMWFDSLIAWVLNNPFLVLFMLIFAYKLYFSSQKPFPTIPGAKIKSIHSLDEFNELLQYAKLQKYNVLVDYYATWYVIICGSRLIFIYSPFLGVRDRKSVV